MSLTNAAWISAGGGALSSLLSVLSTGLANSTSKEIASDNRKWMTRMANTAHQREVKDLREAGLNPILSATGGSGAATPAASTSVDIKTPDFSGLTDIGESIARIEKLQAETKNIDTATSLLNIDKVSKTHDAFIRGIEAKYIENKEKYGTDEARHRAISSLIELDKQTARAAFDLSQIGLEAYAAKELSNAYPGSFTGSVSGPLKFMLNSMGIDVRGNIPVSLLKQLHSAEFIREKARRYNRDWDYYDPEENLRYGRRRGVIRVVNSR